MKYKYLKVLQKHPEQAIQLMNSTHEFTEKPDFVRDNENLIRVIAEAKQKTGRELSDDFIVKYLKKSSEDDAFDFMSYDYENDNSADLEIVKDEIKQALYKNFAYELYVKAETGSQYSEDEILKSYADYVPSNKPSVDYKTRLSSQNGLHKAAEKFKAKVNELSISSGFPQWDEVLQGRGFKPASTYCIQGLSGTGKSIFTCNVARRIFMDGKNVLFISTEMDDAEITDRIIRAETSKSEHKFDEAVVEFDNLLGSGNHGEIELVKVHPGTTTVYDIEKEIQKLDFKPDILIIDYADQIAITDKGVSEYDKHGIVYDHLKRIAGEYYIPILTATQTNRSAADENGGTKSYIGMTTVSDSMKKLHALDSMFGIVQTVQDKDEGKISLSIVKNRGGMGHGMVDFSINYNYMRLGNIFIKNTTPKRSKEKEEKDETTYKHINSPVEIRYFNTIIQENMSPIDGAKYLKEKMRHKEIDKDEYDAIMLEVRSYRRRRDEAKNN